MEFHEKLQELRKRRGLTQEELAEALYVSRTAVSKWESGRGYPGIDSLKAIAGYFSVSIDDLLSGERLLTIAESESRANLRSMCDLLLGIVDLLSLLLIILPLYPHTVDGFVYSVSLMAYDEASPLIRMTYWGLYIALAAAGAAKVLQNRTREEKCHERTIGISMALSVMTVLVLAVSGATYATALAFLLLVIKGLLLIRRIQA